MATSSSLSFYGRKGPSNLPKRPRLNLAEAIRMSHDLSDLDIDLSDTDDIDTGSQNEEEDLPSEPLNVTPNENMFNFDCASENNTPRPQVTPLNSTPVSSARSYLAAADISGGQLADIILHQNELMLQLIKKQDSMGKSIDEMKQELKETTSNVAVLLEDKKKQQEHAVIKNKRKYPSSLTDRLSCLHKSSELQFDPTKSFTDRVNVDTKQFLRTELSSSYGKEYSDEQISLAIQRLYESQRRGFINNQPENTERTQEAELRKKYRARRERLFTRRTKFVPAKIRKSWDKLNLHFMSEEEDGDDGDTILVKKLPWRSGKLNELIAKLDTAAMAAAKKSPTFTPERKKRVESINSDLPPPADSPEWALKPQFRKGSNKENEN